MFATIRKYQVDPAKLADFNRSVNEGFLPIIRKAPGFVSYQGVDAGNGAWVSLSLFETRAGAEESSRLAASFVAEHLKPLIVAGPDLVTGDIVVDASRRG